MNARFILLLVVLSLASTCQNTSSHYIDPMLEGKWELSHALVDGAKKLDYSLEAEGGNMPVVQPWVSISGNTLKGFDGCNEIWFDFSLSASGNFQTISYHHTAKECGPVVVSNKDTGQVYDTVQVDGELFKEGWVSATAYEVSENQLVIYFPQSRANHLVFQKVEQE